MALTDLSYFGLIIICFIVSTLPIKYGKVIAVAIANLVFLYSYGKLQLTLALLLTVLVGFLALFAQKKKQSWIIASFVVVGLMALQRTMQTFNIANGFALMAFSYSGLKAIRYINQVGRGIVKQNNVFLLFDYLFYFPSFLQGPIMDYDQFYHSLLKDDGFDAVKRREGFMQALIGYALRSIFVLAILPIYQDIFANSSCYQVSVKVIALLTYCVILYLDWDAYSNIVVGCSKFIGIEISENFKAPLMAKDGQDFWRRWHISLSTFLKDFVYIPLGGSHCSKKRSYLNNVITFAVCGLWHGVNVLYLAWGIVNGIAVVIARFGKTVSSKLLSTLIGQLSKVIILIALSVYGFTSLPIYLNFLNTLFVSGSKGIVGLLTFNQWIVYTIFILLYGLLDWCRYHFDAFASMSRWFYIFRILLYCALIVCIMIFGVYGPGYEASHFIYEIF